MEPTIRPTRVIGTNDPADAGEWIQSRGQHEALAPGVPGSNLADRVAPQGGRDEQLSELG